MGFSAEQLAKWVAERTDVHVCQFFIFIIVVVTVQPQSNEVPRDWEIGSLYRGFIISRFCSIHYAITGLKNIVCYTEDFVI